MSDERPPGGMRFTAAGTITVAVIAGAVVGALLDHALATTGRALFTPEYTLPFTLVALAAVLIGLAIPIRRAARSEGKKRVNPFQAVRILVLAKAGAITGALLSGFSIGLLGYLLSRSTPAGVGSFLPVILAGVGAVVLTVAALIAERFCSLPKDPDDDLSGASSLTA